MASRGTVATGGSAGTVAAGGSGFPTSGQTGPGFTATEINIGFQNSEGLQEAFKLIGASGTPGDDREISEAMVAWLNKNGGITGRKVVPIHHQTPSTSGTWASQAQAACATFGEDNKVVVAVSGFVGGSDAMSGCMAAKKIAYVESNIWGFSAADFSRLPRHHVSAGADRTPTVGRASMSTVCRAPASSSATRSSAYSASTHPRTRT